MIIMYNCFSAMITMHNYFCAIAIVAYVYVLKTGETVTKNDYLNMNMYLDQI